MIGLCINTLKVADCDFNNFVVVFFFFFFQMIYFNKTVIQMYKMYTVSAANTWFELKVYLVICWGQLGCSNFVFFENLFNYWYLCTSTLTTTTKKRVEIISSQNYSICH